MSTPQDKGNRHCGVCTGACLDRHACQTGRQSWSARPGSSGTALTRGARSGSLHVSREVGLPAVLAYERRQPPTLVGGPHRIQPRRLVGLSLHESSQSGVPGLHPRQRPLSGSAILIIAEPLDSVFITPNRGVPSICPRSLLLACARDGMTGSRLS